MEISRFLYFIVYFFSEETTYNISLFKMCYTI